MTFILPLWFAVAPLVLADPTPAPATLDAATLRAQKTCADSLDLAIFNSPRRPHTRAPMRILITSEGPLAPSTTLVALAPGSTTPLTTVPFTTFEGPPLGLVATIDRPAAGDWRVALVNGGTLLACQDIEVRNGPSGPGPLEVGVDPHWETRIRWERDTENLYSLWIQRLFDAPPTEDVSWNPLALVLKDPERNLLYDHLGLGEDKDGLRANPDCADFPYTLRAYFAWKMGLPMAMRNCRRGNAERPPSCGVDLVTSDLPTTEANRVMAFKAFMRKLMGTIHSSSLRGAPGDEKSDLYPVKLDRHGLRPGTMYADPYGHTMMVLRWYPQTDTQAGILMAVDAQPDGTVGRRVFWKGAFLFPKDDAVAGAGWKRFRPVRKRGDTMVELSNEEIAQSIDYGDYSVEQWSRGQEGFYEAMDALISPRPMAPDIALIGILDALHQQALRRVESIEAVRAYFDKPNPKVIGMPDGSDIFLTAGPWEDYSTPSRDMRMLIAIDTILDFPARVGRHPGRFVLPDGEPAPTRDARLRALTETEAKKRNVTYQRSDGTPFTLSLYDLMQRGPAIEVAWNPNDCPEARWGAPEGSVEAAPCRRRAPDAQRQKMETMRPWFQKRERPLQH
ncbi:MAG: hypothetical protein JNJ59_19830 [Deltaproteobacteria bacterium]|nr:hypothetical protein [Deltaproteobacteria bacterium]